MKKLLYRVQYSLQNEDGITTVEVILLMVVLITVVLIFKEQIMELVENIMESSTISPCIYNYICCKYHCIREISIYPSD